MALVNPIDDILNHNSHKITIIPRKAFKFNHDRAIISSNASYFIRGYIFTEGRKRRIFRHAGELTMHSIKMWVSNKWLDRKGFTIYVDDIIYYQNLYYEIESSVPIEVQARITEYKLTKWIGILDVSTAS